MSYLKLKNKIYIWIFCDIFMDNLMKAYLEYDPDKDYNGAQGRAIADALLDRCGGNLEIMRKKIALAKLEKSLLEISETGKGIVISH